MTAVVGSVVGSVGLAVLVVVGNRAWRAAGLLAWATGCALLAGYLAPAGHAWLYVAVGVAGTLAAAALAVAFLRLPWLLAAAALACAPVRVTVSVGQTSADLLVPLYVVVAGAALALAWQLLWRSARPRELGAFAWPLALFVCWSGIALAWSHDRRQGAVYLLCYLLPFALLAVAVARIPWIAGWATALYAQLAAMATAFAVIGIWQYETRDLTWSPAAIAEGAHVTSSWFYRVDSVFQDPATYGRFLAVAVLVGLALVLYASRGVAWAALLAVAVAFAGLVPSFSRASYVALGAGVVLALGVLWGRRSVVGVAVAFAALLALAAGVAQESRAVSVEPSKPVSDAIRIARDHPAFGVGTGGFRTAFGKDAPGTAAPRDTPVVVAAETGAPGLALLAWLAAAMLVVPLRRNPARGPTGRALLGLGLALLAFMAHSFVDGRLFEDPLFFAALALVAVAARAEAVA